MLLTSPTSVRFDFTRSFTLTMSAEKNDPDMANARKQMMGGYTVVFSGAKPLCRKSMPCEVNRGCYLAIETIIAKRCFNNTLLIKEYSNHNFL